MLYPYLGKLERTGIVVETVFYRICAGMSEGTLTQ